MSIVSHMCIKLCVAFIGPYADLDTCSECGEPRFDQLQQNRGNKCPCAVFHTIPIGPQLQALWQHPESADKMSYRAHKTQQILNTLFTKDGLVDAYNDIFCGSTYLQGIYNGTITLDNTLLMISIDGAQLYKFKESDCWIYIWIILDSV